MKKLLLNFIFLLAGSNQLVLAQQEKRDIPAVKINWVKNLEGDFTFTKKWEYPRGVEKKKDGKAGCADGGFCPQRCYGMLDSNGIVLKDSARIFYQLLDTTHIPYSIECDASCYEYAGTNLITAVKNQYGRVIAITEGNMATHCSLYLEINEEYCLPYIYLNSITNDGDKYFYYKSGTITIDENYFSKNILKAEFDLTFTNVYEASQPVYWKGKIYAAIKKED